MSEHCPNLEGCPIFRYFRDYAQDVYRAIYCEGDYCTCLRYQLKQRGQPVPENLLPQGTKLWDDPPAQPI